MCGNAPRDRSRSMLFSMSARGSSRRESVWLAALHFCRDEQVASRESCRAGPDDASQRNARGVGHGCDVRYYERFAQDGFGLLITEGIHTDMAFSQGYRNQPGPSDGEQAVAWRNVIDAVHAAGGKIFAQADWSRRASTVDACPPLEFNAQV